MPYNHLWCPLLLLPWIFPSIRVFSNESVLHIRWPKYWSFSFRISPSNKQPGLISFRMDWLVLLAVQGTLKSLLQHHSSKASILWCSAFFRVQLSHPYVTTAKPIALTRRTFVGKVMPLLFNMPSQFSSFQSLSHVWLFETPWSKDAWPPCPSLAPRVHPNPRPLSQWCHPTVSSSVVPLCSCPQSFPASGSFPVSLLLPNYLHLPLPLKRIVLITRIISCQ